MLCPAGIEVRADPQSRLRALRAALRLSHRVPAAPGSEEEGEDRAADPYCRRLYEAHAEIWEGLEESQGYLDGKIVIANERKHGTTLRRPKEVFFQEEKSALKALPALAYEIEQVHEGIVRQDGCVRFANKYYSVAEAHKGKTVCILGDSKRVSIYLEGTLWLLMPNPEKVKEQWRLVLA